MSVCTRLGSQKYSQQRLNAVLLYVSIKFNLSQIVINIKCCLVDITSLLVPDFVLSFPVSTRHWAPPWILLFLDNQCLH